MARGYKPGRWEGTYITLIERVGATKKHAIWQARCDCGTVFNVRPDQIQTGRTKSCGCHRSHTSRQNIMKAAAYRFQPGSNKPPLQFTALLAVWK